MIDKCCSCMGDDFESEREEQERRAGRETEREGESGREAAGGRERGV